MCTVQLWLGKIICAYWFFKSMNPSDRKGQSQIECCQDLMRMLLTSL